MSEDCDKRWPEIVEWIHGVDVPDAARHLTDCGECRAKAEGLKQVLDAFAAESFEVPFQALEIAKSAGHRRPTKYAHTRLFRLLGEGARSLADGCQVDYECDDVQIRLQYRSVEDGIEISGVVSRETGEIIGPVVVDTNRGRFFLIVPSWDDTELIYRDQDIDVILPSPKDVRRK